MELLSDRTRPHGEARPIKAQNLRLSPREQTREASMGKVIHVAFGTEREWEQTRAKTADGLVTIGSLFGDDEALMRAKADCVYQILREIVEEVPSVQITTKMPENLSTEQLELLTGAIKEEIG